MGILMFGLVVFLGVHSVRIVADGWRGAQIARFGAGPWKGVYSLLSLGGFALVIVGYGIARQHAAALWVPPLWTRHLAALLMLVSFVLLAAAYVPGNGLKARLHHPMVLSVKVWALSHLLANSSAADLLLFGSFLVWSVFSFRAARARDRAQQVVYSAGTSAGTATAVAVGVVAWAVFAFWAHRVLIGVRPFG